MRHVHIIYAYSWWLEDYTPGPHLPYLFHLALVQDELFSPFLPMQWAGDFRVPQNVPGCGPPGEAFMMKWNVLRWHANPRLLCLTKNGVGATLKIDSHHKPSGMLRCKMKPQFFHFKYSCSLDLKCPPRNSSWYFISYLLISVINKNSLPKSFLSIWLYTLKNSLVIRCQEIMLFESKCNVFESKNHQRK